MSKFKFKKGQKVKVSDDEKFVRSECGITNPGFNDRMVDDLGTIGIVLNEAPPVLVESPRGEAWFWPESCLDHANLLDVLIGEAEKETE